MAETATPLSWAEFERVDLRVGTILEARAFPQARKPAYQLLIDLGPEIGHKRSSAQITQRYHLPDLVGRQVVCVVNFPPRQIGPFRSEVLVTGFADTDGAIVLIGPDAPVPNGQRLH